MIERHQALWIWMGAAGDARSELIPDFSATEERNGWTRVKGHLHINANYQLIADNLLDLSHVQFLHSFLASSKAPPPGFRSTAKAEQKGNTVFAVNELRSCWLSPLYRMLWERGEPPVTCDLRANMRWDPPCAMFLDTGATIVDAPLEAGPSLPQGHWLTPETEMTTHYFWAVARDRYVGNEDIGMQLIQGIDSAFRSEDEPMIEAVQRSMGAEDLWSLSPVLLSTDSAPVRARRILKKLIADECSRAEPLKLSAP